MSIQVFRIVAATRYEKEDKVKLEEEVKQGRIKCDLTGKKGNAREYSIIRKETLRMSNYTGKRSERRKHNLTNVPETVQLPFKNVLIYTVIATADLDKEITKRRYSQGLQIDVKSILWTLALIA